MSKRKLASFAAIGALAFSSAFGTTFALVGDDAEAATPPYRGIWLSQAELAALPTSGSAFQAVKAAADGSLGAPAISNQDSDHDVNTLAVALMWQATGDSSYRSKAANAIMSAIGTEDGGRTLALARNLASYVIAADLIDLPGFNVEMGQEFTAWLSAVRNEAMSDGRSLVQMREARGNNWGTNGGAALAAANAYLGDTAALSREAQVFKGWLGDRSSYAGFSWGSLSWQANPSAPVGVNPKDSTIQSRNVDGVLPDDQRRAGGFTWPPPCENYVWGGLGPALVEAEILSNVGYPDAPSWSDSALKRALVWVTNVAGCPANGDDVWAVWLGNSLYGLGFSASSPASPGKPMAWTAWTHGDSTRSGDPEPPPPPPPPPPPGPTPLEQAHTLGQKIAAAATLADAKADAQKVLDLQA